MKQPCDDAGENVQRCKGKPTEALYAVCGHCVMVLLFLAIRRNVLENILWFASVEVAQLVNGG